MALLVIISSAISMSAADIMGIDIDIGGGEMVLDPGVLHALLHGEPPVPLLHQQGPEEISRPLTDRRRHDVLRSFDFIIELDDLFSCALGDSSTAPTITTAVIIIIMFILLLLMLICWLLCRCCRCCSRLVVAVTMMVSVAGMRVVEREAASEHNEQYTTRRPTISEVPSVVLPTNDLWGRVTPCPTRRIEPVMP